MMEGYKKTDIGYIPNDWKFKKLKDVSDFANGKGHEQSIDEDGEYIVVNSKFISTNGLVRKFSTQNLSPLKKGDITMVMSDIPNGRAIAKCFIIDEDNRYTLNQRICSIISKEFCDTKFLYYVINRNRYYLAFDNGVSQTNLRKDEVIDCPIQIPPLQEQQKIAEILSTVDDKIDVIDQQISETQALKKGLMQRLLTKGISHTEFKDSPLGEIPKSWDVVKLVEVSLKIGDGLHATPKYVDNSEYYFVNGNNLVNGKLTIYGNTKCVSEQEYVKHNINIASSSILMSINGTIGNIAFYNGELVVFGKSACYISPNLIRLDKNYLYYYLQMDEIKKYYSDELTGTTIKNLSLKSVRHTPTALPSMNEQQKIASILSSVDEKIEVLEDKKTHYKELKQGLMQQLLTGKIRVNGLINKPTMA